MWPLLIYATQIRYSEAAATTCYPIVSRGHSGNNKGLPLLWEKPLSYEEIEGPNCFYHRKQHSVGRRHTRFHHAMGLWFTWKTPLDSITGSKLWSLWKLLCSSQYVAEWHRVLRPDSMPLRLWLNQKTKKKHLLFFLIANKGMDRTFQMVWRIRLVTIGTHTGRFVGG